VSLLGPGDGPLPVLQIGPPRAAGGRGCPIPRRTAGPGHTRRWPPGRSMRGGPQPPSPGPSTCPCRACSAPACSSPTGALHSPSVVPGVRRGTPGGAGARRRRTRTITGPGALAPAWTVPRPAPPSVTLPRVRPSGRSAPGRDGDFASLARALRVQPPGHPGQPADRCDRPGFAVPAGRAPGTTVPAGRPLQPMGANDSPPAAVVRPRPDAFRAALEADPRPGGRAGHDRRRRSAAGARPPLLRRWYRGGRHLSATSPTG
jgi:hypothetical protein